MYSQRPSESSCDGSEDHQCLQFGEYQERGSRSCCPIGYSERDLPLENCPICTDGDDEALIRADLDANDRGTVADAHVCALSLVIHPYLENINKAALGVCTDEAKWVEQCLMPDIVGTHVIVC